MRNIRRTIENLLKGAGSLLDIMPPERPPKFYLSRKYAGPGKYLTPLERDWCALGGDMRTALGNLKKAYER